MLCQCKKKRGKSNQELQEDKRRLFPEKHLSKAIQHRSEKHEPYSPPVGGLNASSASYNCVTLKELLSVSVSQCLHP